MKQKLFSFFEGKCSEEEISLIKDWLEQSKDNKTYFLQTRKLYDVGIFYNIEDESASGGTLVEKNKQNKKMRLFTNAAAVALILIISIFTYNKIQINKIASLEQTISTQVSQCTNIELVDGTKVWLNSQSSLRYNPLLVNNDGSRVVFVDGEAFFDVKQDNSNTPFIVETSKGKVQVHGTQFNVKDYSEDVIFEVSLIKGLVGVKLNEEKEFKVLTPCTLARLNKAGILEMRPINNFDPYTWKEGLLTFNEITFKEMMTDFGRYFDFTIIIENPTVIQHKYTGKFRIVDGIDYALRILQKSIDFKDVQDSENRIIYIR